MVKLLMDLLRTHICSGILVLTVFTDGFALILEFMQELCHVLLRNPFHAMPRNMMKYCDVDRLLIFHGDAAHELRTYV
jgi:hypothetical protein